MKKEYARLLVFFGIHIRDWATLLVDNGKYDEATGLINEIRALLKDFIDNGHLPDEMKKLSEEPQQE